MAGEAVLEAGGEGMRSPVSTDLEFFAPNYLRAHQRWPEASLLSEQYRSLVDAYRSGHCSLPEHAKGYVECVCRTILDDCGKGLPEANPPLGRLLSAAFEAVGLQNTRDGSSANRILSCYNKLGEALNAGRNDLGSLAHGRDGFLDALSVNHARSLLLAGDSLIAVLLEALEGTQPNLRYTREPYERFSHLNDRIDQAVVTDVQLDESDGTIVVTFDVPGDLDSFDIRVTPSALLFGLDRTAYMSVLESAAAYGITVEVEESESEVAARPGDLHGALPDSDARDEPAVVVTASYAGRLDPMRAGLSAIVKELSDAAPVGLNVDEGLLDSILATVDANSGLDWSGRESGRARVRVALRRLMTGLGAAEAASGWSDGLERWFVSHWDEAA